MRREIPADEHSMHTYQEILTMQARNDILGEHR